MVNRNVLVKLRIMGFFLVGTYLMGSFLLASRFAEIHFTVPMLGLPVFLGEILFFLCLVLAAVILRLEGWPSSASMWFWILYVVFVLLKAGAGYAQWGLLALRHAALFYYPLFALFAFIFYDPEIRPSKFFIITIVLFSSYALYANIFIKGFFFPVLMVNLALLSKLNNKKLAFVLAALILAVFPYQRLFFTSRSFLVAHCLTISYLSVALLCFLPLKRLYKIIAVGAVLCALIISALVFNEGRSLYSAFNFPSIAEQFRAYDRRAKVNREKGQVYDLEVRVFNPDASDERYEVHTQQGEVVLKPRKETDSGEDTGIVQEMFAGKQVKKRITRTISVSYNNILFRLFIWRDMFREFTDQWPLLGFDFGKPLRSPTVEAIGWGAEAWYKDGWVSAHNSYLHIIYRAGTVGLLCVLVLLKNLASCITVSFRQKSLPGMFLFAGACLFFITALFLPVLELPYYAIPCWVLLGLYKAHVDHWKSVNNKRREQLS